MMHKHKIICTTRANKVLDNWSYSSKLKVKKNGIDKVIIRIYNLPRKKLKI